MASAATLLKSSFLPKKSEWGASRQVAAPRPVTVSMVVVRASAYADELVKTAVLDHSDLLLRSSSSRKLNDMMHDMI